MACDVLELCLIATKIEGFKSLLPKYGMSGKYGNNSLMDYTINDEYVDIATLNIVILFT
jgi:hypothetical protein